MVISLPNGLIVTAIRRSRDLKRPLYLLMANLAVADILLGVSFTSKFIIIVLKVEG